MFTSSDEANAPIRQIVPLDITDEERRAAQFYDPLLASMSDETANAFVEAQRQAQAISASLAAASAVAKSTSPRAENSGGKRKLTEKELVDMIPADR